MTCGGASAPLLPKGGNMSEHDYMVEIQNPHASEPLKIAVTSNVTLEEINRNVAVNSAKDIDWFSCRNAFTEKAIIVGGGPSLKDSIDIIRRFEDDAVIIAVNGASQYLSAHDLVVDFQFIMDARPQNVDLIDLDAENYIFASQCAPIMFDIVPHARTEMVHLHTPGIEDQFPPHKRDAGGYTLIGGMASVGNSALCLAHAMGYRELHVFGFDSSVDGDKRHAYPQSMNANEQLVQKRFNDRMYWMSYAMAVQYDGFFLIEEELKKLGTSVIVYGDGILPARWRMKHSTVEPSEVEKYTMMWDNPDYRRVSPGAQKVHAIACWLPHKASVLDIGCGTGRASVYLAERGYNPTLMDFADNCRDPEALSFPFILHDISQPFNVSWRYGICCDVMEHIPPEQVETVLNNIATACADVFFRIEFEPDYFGPATLGRPLHLSVHDEVWWSEELSKFWPVVDYKGDGIFIVRRD